MLNEFERKIVELWKENYSTAMIGEKLGVTKNIICGRVFRMRARGVDLPPRAIITPSASTTEKRRPYNRKKIVTAPLIDLIFKKQKEEKVRPIIVVKEAPLAKPNNIKFKQLTAKSCRYVVNDGRPENFIFCGAPKERGAYCEAHALICYAPSKPPERKQHNPNAQQRYYR